MNEEAIQHECTEKKATAKVCKDHQDEAAEDSLVIEREGNTLELSKLREELLSLKTKNQCLHSRAHKAKVQDNSNAQRLIPAPNKGDMDVELICQHLGLSSNDHDCEWLKVWDTVRSVVCTAGLDWTKRWAKQDYGWLSIIYEAAKNRCPALRQFADHWAVEFIGKQFFHNHFNSQCKKHNTEESDVNVTDGNHDSTMTNPGSGLMAFCQAALRHAVECKAAKWKAMDVEELSGGETPDNDSETELEDLPDSVRKAVKREEIGVHVSTPKATMKPIEKQTVKKRPVVYLKRGCGGKVCSAGRDGGSEGPAPDDAVSESSGQTTSGSEN
ncbi:hypothetical protein CTheo_9038 [Ceratobasidium theobromae]|uniref:Uncharacterized protein n=1 Tax=Ceratobasidium theobromae TaxID=1582974 RepID=A0A5N5Q7R4_9AGAM|nr:hypothetical protein CTheo_9038 [Ceratobasidium theobromae]